MQDFYVQTLQKKTKEKTKKENYERTNITRGSREVIPKRNSFAAKVQVAKLFKFFNLNNWYKLDDFSGCMLKN